MPLDESIIGGQLGHLADHDVLHKKANAVVYAKADGGLKGDGTLESGAAVEALMILAAGKTLIFEAGSTFLMPLHAHPSSATTYAQMFIRSGTTIIGDGATIKLPNSTARPGGATATNLIRNLSAGDSNIAIQGLTVDGNGGNQSGQTMQHQGVIFTQAKGVRLLRVKVQNLHGLGYAPDAPTVGDVECMGISFNMCQDCAATDCGVIRTAGSMSTGFSANTSTNVAYVNCIAVGMSVACGFAHNGCRNVVHSNCEAYDNVLFGFNSENSEAALYAACIAGGRAANTGGLTSFGHTADENLGNGYGFRFSGTIGYHLAGCAGRYNVQDGVFAQVSSQGTVNGGYYSNNGSAGIRADAASTGLTTIVGSPILGNNTAGDIMGGGTGFSRDMFGFQKVSTSPYIAANSQAFVHVRDDGGTLNPEIRFYRPTGTGLWRSWAVKANAASASAVLEVLAGNQAAVGSETLTRVLSIDLSGNLTLGPSTGPALKFGTGTPEGVVTAPIGSLFLRTDGGAGTSLYVKQSGVGNTGWAGK